MRRALTQTYVEADTILQRLTRLQPHSTGQSMAYLCTRRKNPEYIYSYSNKRPHGNSWSLDPRVSLLPPEPYAYDPSGWTVDKRSLPSKGESSTVRVSPHHEAKLRAIEDTSVLSNVLAVLRESKPIFS
jgi:hypothetical protein